MKKSFLFLLISIMTVFLIAGCAEDTTKGEETTPVTDGSESLDIKVTGPTEIDLNQPETLIGTYEITFFYTDGGSFVVLTNDCANATDFGASKACDNIANQQVEMKGYGTISHNAQGDTYQIMTKIQIKNDFMLTFEIPDIIKLSDQQYNFTTFTPIPKGAITSNGINSGNTAVKGTTGRNLTQNVTGAESTYSFTVDTDKLTIINSMQDKSSGYATANVTVRMKKISNEVTDLKVNKPLPTPYITGFQPTVQ